MSGCTIGNCLAPAVATGLCGRHYYARRRASENRSVAGLALFCGDCDHTEPVDQWGAFRMNTHARYLHNRPASITERTPRKP